MPLYEYECKSCGYVFEDLKNSKEDSSTAPCKKCGFSAEKLVSTFSSVVAGGSSNEPVDMSIGREANKRWQSYTDRQSKRRSGKVLEEVSLPKSKDGKFMPVMALGDNKDRGNRKDYTVALQEHRQDRVKRGMSQFSEPGPF